jgi:hypothetical protein
MSSEDAPAFSFSQDELTRLRKVRRAFLREQGIPPREQEDGRIEKGKP